MADPCGDRLMDHRHDVFRASIPNRDPELTFSDRKYACLREHAIEHQLVAPDRLGHAAAQIVTHLAGCRNREHDTTPGTRYTGMVETG